MKLLNTITSIVMAKFFIGNKLFKKNIKNSSNDIIKLIDNKIYNKSELENINSNKEDLLKIKYLQFVIINEVGYFYDILYIDKKNGISSVFNIEIIQSGETSILLFSKDLQINKKMEYFFFLFYWFGLITMIFEIGVFLYNLYSNSSYEIKINEFGMTLFYLSFVPIWGLCIKYYINTVVSKKIKLFMNQFEELIFK
jgi:hypothetical protein